MGIWNWFWNRGESRSNAQTIGHPRDPGLSAFFGPQPGASGIAVTENSAMSFSALYSGLKFICETMASLPWEVQELNEEGWYSYDLSHPVNDILNVQMNPEMCSMVARETMLMQAFLFGCSYGEIVTNGRGEVRQIWPIHPNRVTPKRNDSGKLVFEVASDIDNGQSKKTLEDDQVFRTPVMSRDGITGRGLLAYAEQCFGLSLAAETEAAAFFGNGSKPGGLLTLKDVKSMSPEKKEEIKNGWENRHGSSKNAHKVAVMSGDVTWTPIQLSPDQSQALETRRFQVLEVARWLNLPPQFLMFFENGIGDIEQLMLLLKTFTLRSWMVRLQQEAKVKLFRKSERNYRTLINLDSLLQADIKTRFEAYSNGRQNGYLKLNEIRRWEGLPPLHKNQGETVLIPMNMQPQMEGDPVPDNSKVSTPSAKEPGANPVQSKDGPVDTKRSLPPGLLVAHRSIIADAMGRMIRKESKAAQQAAGKPREWLAWVDDFYAKHERQLSEALLPGLTAHCASVETWEQPLTMAERMAKQHCEASRKALIDASDGDASKFADRVQELTENWTQQRADSFADDLLKQELANV